MKPKQRFTIGYNHNLDFLKIIHKYKDFISGIYFPLPDKLSGSGRSIPQPDSYEEEILKIIEFGNKFNINSELLLNATCEGERMGDLQQMEKIINYLKKLEEKGLKKVVLTNLLYAEQIKKKTNLILEAPVILNVNTLLKIKYLHQLGFESINLATEKNRDLSFIKNIKDKFPGMNIKLMVNEGCLPDCPFRQTHFNFIAHHHQGEELENIFCENYLQNFPEIFFKIPIITPEEIKNYLNLADEFKLVSRCRKMINIYKIIKAYTSGTFEGNLLDIIELNPLREHIKYIDNKKLQSYNYLPKINNCNNDCDNCHYCRDLLKLVLN
jgi:collagenase-like PrtC family protease